MSKVQPEFNYLSVALGRYGAKENYLKAKWRKRLEGIDSAAIELSGIISEFLDDLSTPAEVFFLSGENR